MTLPGLLSVHKKRMLPAPEPWRMNEWAAEAREEIGLTRRGRTNNPSLNGIDINSPSLSAAFESSSWSSSKQREGGSLLLILKSCAGVLAQLSLPANAVDGQQRVERERGTPHELLLLSLTPVSNFYHSTGIRLAPTSFGSFSPLISSVIHSRWGRTAFNIFLWLE